MGTTRKDRELSTEGPRAAGALSSDRVADSYRPDGTWSCTSDHRTTPCGNCDGCRYIQGANAADRAAANDEPLPLQSAFEGACDVKGCAVCGSASHFLHIAQGAYSYRAPRFPEPAARFFSGRLLAQ